MKELEPVIKMLDEILEERGVPKNIKKAVEESKNYLNNDKMQPEVKISAAVHRLDEITNDPNMPIYIRTKIWNIMSILEQIRSRL
jgi:uncharacterized protein (UPF0147 family)